MEYSIKEVAKKMNMSTSTIRYYDQEGLLPNIKRRESGYRVFSDDDIAYLELIDCLKKTGLSIKELKQFSGWLTQGEESLQARYNMFVERKKAIEDQMNDLNKSLELVSVKCNYYKKALMEKNNDK